MAKYLHFTILTHIAPSANYRGESEENRTVLQKVTGTDGHEYCIVSPESMRNALREMLAQGGLPMNRRRLHTEEQLAVEFTDFPNPREFADDFLFGYMVADKEAVKAMNKRGTPPKRDSVLRMNLAVALAPYVSDATFHQSPLNAGRSPWKNSTTSALLHREVSVTAYQYPVGLALGDFPGAQERAWGAALLRAFGELTGVAGGHARSLYEMAPRSIVARLTTCRVAGYATYGFEANGSFPELERLRTGDLPGREFFVGGELARSMEAKDRVALGATFDDNPQRLLATLAARAFEVETP